MTGVMVLLSAGEAQRLTQRIKLLAGGVRDNLYKLRNLVDEAKASNAWQVLGFPSWTAYLVDTLASEPMRLDRAERQTLVEYLSGEGLSTRAIAPIVGVDQKTVVRDLAGEAYASPTEPVDQIARDVAEAEAQSMPPALIANPQTGEILEEGTESEPVLSIVTETHTVKTVTGLDGKTYTQQPAQSRRSPLIDDARSAGWALRKAVERLERIKADDRFTNNKVEIMAALQPHLDFANEAISGL